MSKMQFGLALICLLASVFSMAYYDDPIRASSGYIVAQFWCAHVLFRKDY